MKHVLSLAFLLALGAAPLAQAQSCAGGGGATVCLTATGSNNNVTLNWTVTGAISKVQVYRDTDSNPTGRSRVAQLNNAGITSYVDSGAATGTHYWYWIKFNVGNASYSSNAADATRVVVSAQGGGGTPGSPGTMRNITSLQLSQEMAPGWNLGNSLEAIGGETNWGNAATTPALINAIKAAGFNSVRIPLSWKQYADSNDNIRADWMARATEVVNYARNAGLYAIINIHWDGGWMQPNYATQAFANARITKFWTQIANNFKNYDDHLLFAALNEVMIDGDYGTPTSEYYTVHNSFNQTFVNAVRATGGNNATRHLVVQGFNTNVDHTYNFFAVPNDSASNRLLLEVHYYDPYDFTINTANDNIWQWGSIATNPANTETWANESYVNAQFDKLKQRFTDGLGIPVVVGEYAAIARLNVDPSQQYRTYWDQYITSATRQRGQVPMYWDNGYSGDHQMGLFNRANGAKYFPSLISAIVNAR
ncbi:glycoside hydrolase family 5 protein [Ideonella sp. YS5]|uniref:glycoside hydrolase family 5 protein n=1 Tax=Ideonella sp. YS5 TaxID=3453714 RepID=UPI003EE98375